MLALVTTRGTRRATRLAATRCITLALCALCGALAACGSIPTTARTDVGLRTLGPRTLASDDTRSLYDAITFYWPDVTSPPWMSRSITLRGVEPVGVYANGAIIGDFASLRSVRAQGVARVSRLTPMQEQLTFGRQHPAGALVIEWAR